MEFKLKQLGSLLVLLLLLTACGEDGLFSFLGGGNRTSATPTTTDTNYYTGTQGVDIEFLNDMGGMEVYEDTVVQLVVRVHNRGAIDIPFRDNHVSSDSGTVVLSYDSFYLEDASSGSQSSSRQNVDLQGKSDLNPQGEELVLDAGSLTVLQIVGQRESPDTQVFVNFCYPYKTFLSKQVCIDKYQGRYDSRPETDRGCSATDIAARSGQGAPVAITLVEVNNIPVLSSQGTSYTRPTYIIHAENVGPGSVLESADGRTSQEACALQSEVTSLNNVRIEASIADIPLDCIPQPFRMIDGQGKVSCVLNENDMFSNSRLFGRQDNFETTLNVELYYAYTVDATTTLELMRLPDGTNGGSIGGGADNDRCGYWQSGSPGSCVDNCDGKGDYWKCTCDREACVELFGVSRCVVEQGLCDPGHYCCQEFLCEDFTGSELKCEKYGCAFCDTDTRDCVNPGESCPAPPAEEGGTV
ncbi:hypothetical protein ACFL1B_04100 [Nanoarchaeota archaeon]